LQQLSNPCATLSHKVCTRDAAIDNTVLDVLRDVRSADKQNVNWGIATGKGECPFARLFWSEPCDLK
jgi:hypothetical protein